MQFYYNDFKVSTLTANSQCVNYSFSASKIQERHVFLFNTIGYLQEEQDAYFNVWLYFDLSLGFMCIGSLYQWIFFMLYNQKFHPFADITMNIESYELTSDKLNSKKFIVQQEIIQNC